VSIAHSDRSCGYPPEREQRWRVARSLSRVVRGEGTGSVPDSKGVSPAKANPFWPRYTNSMAANLPKVMKPATGGEAVSLCSRRAIRGETGGRASTDRSGTWEARCGASGWQSSKGWCAVAPSSRVRQKGRERKWLNTPPRVRSLKQRPWGIHNPGGVRSRESERPIVAWKRGNARGAKGPYFSHATVEGGTSA
jgi:hypothetical protein